METGQTQAMLSPKLSEPRYLSKRDIPLWHLRTIYGLLALTIATEMLSLVFLFHLNQRQLNFEKNLDIRSSSGNNLFNTPQSVKHKAKELPSDSEYQVEELHEEEVYDRQSRSTDAESEYTADASRNRILGLPESGQRNLSGVAWHNGPTNTGNSNLTQSLEDSEDERARNSVEMPFEHQEPKEELTSVPNGRSSTSESSTTKPSRRGLRTRLSREIRSREGDEEATVTVRTQRNNRGRRVSKNRIARQHQKSENESRLQGMAAIHLHAPQHMERQYESGPMVSLNASFTKDTVYRFWRKASWVTDSVDDVFHLDETTGHVTVEIEGLYMIYAQMVYHDLSGRWSFGIYVGDQEKVKCLATEQLRDLQSYHPTSHGVYQSCYTAIVLYIRKNQSVTIRCMYGSRTILTRPEFTFWGMVRLS